ncbi:MAG: hypothetical protein PHQ35_01660 [Phycisphaerae bacterium]|nr:hypothetical protein [Phycisphaerae bacterium]
MQTARHLQVDVIVEQATDNKRINYVRLLIEIESCIPLNLTTDNFSKALFNFFAVAQFCKP